MLLSWKSVTCSRVHVFTWWVQKIDSTSKMFPKGKRYSSPKFWDLFRILGFYVEFHELILKKTQWKTLKKRVLMKDLSFQVPVPSGKLLGVKNEEERRSRPSRPSKFFTRRFSGAVTAIWILSGNYVILWYVIHIEATPRRDSSSWPSEA